MSKVNQSPSVAIACASGGFKAIFVHGVLSAFEAANFRANAYASASASVFATAWAVIGKAREAGVNYSLENLEIYSQTKSMSQVCLRAISYFNANGGDKLWESNKSEFYIAASAVTNPEAAEQTQSKQARRLGKKLLISAAKGDRDWVERSLRLDLFGSGLNNDLALERDNFAEVAYASTRMLHAWDLPAWIDHKPYIDASYTCVCPAIEMAELGYQTTIAIATEPGKFYRDLFQLEVIPNRHRQVPIHQIKPDIDLKELGVDITKATPEGLSAVYQHGVDKGRKFLTQLHDEYGGLDR